MSRISVCPNCQGKELFASKKPVSAGGGYAPNYLPGLWRIWGFAAGRFRVVVCGHCGLTRLFAEEEVLPRLRDSTHWERIAPG